MEQDSTGLNLDSPVLSDVSNTVTPRRPRVAVEQPAEQSVMTILGKTNKLLADVIERMDKQENKICQLQEKIESNCSGTSSTPARNRQKEVPLQVRVRTRANKQ